MLLFRCYNESQQHFLKFHCWLEGEKGRWIVLFMGLYNTPLVLKLMGDYHDIPVSYGNPSECSIWDTRLKEDTYTDKNQILCKRTEQSISTWLQINLSLAHLPVSGPWLAQDLFWSRNCRHWVALKVEGLVLEFSPALPCGISTAVGYVCVQGDSWCIQRDSPSNF